METIKASVVEKAENHFIRFVNAGEEISIPLSENKPNEVKIAFNQLIRWVKDSELEIEINEVGVDLFSQVAKEYISQLNSEIKEVREEMVNLGLITNEF